jgi:hypothetical protein
VYYRGASYWNYTIIAVVVASAPNGSRHPGVPIVPSRSGQESRRLVPSRSGPGHTMSRYRDVPTRPDPLRKAECICSPPAKSTYIRAGTSNKGHLLHPAELAFPSLKFKFPNLQNATEVFLLDIEFNFGHGPLCI